MKHQLHTHSTAHCSTWRADRARRELGRADNLRIHAERSYVAARKVVQAEQLLLKEELRFSSNLQLEGVLFRRLHGLRREGTLGEALVRGAGAGRKGGGRAPRSAWVHALPAYALVSACRPRLRRPVTARVSTPGAARCTWRPSRQRRRWRLPAACCPARRAFSLAVSSAPSRENSSVGAPSVRTEEKEKTDAST